jgi:hypothetical protein
MKAFIIASVSIILIMAMGMTTQSDYTEYEELIDKTQLLTDTARIYLDELVRANDSLVNVYFPHEDTISFDSN